jgi:uncharacterized protein (TIGR03083 family)
MLDVFALIAAQRRALADFCETFSDSDWDKESLCAGWSNKHVVAHLTAPFSVSKTKLLAEILKARGSFDVANDRIARRIADTHTPAQIVQSLRVNAEHRFTPPGLGPEAPLTDVNVHSLDVAVALGRTIDISPQAAKVSLDLLVSPKGSVMFMPKGALDGLLFEATDSDWTHGSGSLVRGPTTSLMQALSARRAGYASLSGDGVSVLAQRSK